MNLWSEHNMYTRLIRVNGGHAYNVYLTLLQAKDDLPDQRHWPAQAITLANRKVPQSKKHAYVWPYKMWDFGQQLSVSLNCWSYCCHVLRKRMLLVHPKQFTQKCFLMSLI